MSGDKIELEAWYLPTTTYTRWPSGRFGRAMIAGQPFRVTNPNAILYFNRVSKNNAWLQKMSRTEAEASVSKETLGEVDKEEYVVNRQFADEKIAELEKEVLHRESVLKIQEERIAILETERKGLDETIESLEALNEKNQKLEVKVKKLETALKKAKAVRRAGGN